MLAYRAAATVGDHDTFRNSILGHSNNKSRVEDLEDIALMKDV